MKRNKKKNARLALLLILLTLALGFALLSTTLFINGTASIKSNTWNIHWDSNSVSVLPGSVSAETPEVSTTTTSNDTVSFDVELGMPGQFFEFTVDAVNEGTIDGALDLATNWITYKDGSGQATTLPTYMDFSVKYDDNTVPKSGDILAKRVDANTPTRQTYNVRVEYKSSVEELPENPQPITIEVELPYVQSKSDPDYYGGEATLDEAVLGLWYYEINNDGDHTASIVGVNPNYDDGVLSQIITYGNNSSPCGTYYKDSWGGPTAPNYTKRVVIPYKVKLNSSGNYAPSTGEEYTITRYYEYFAKTSYTYAGREYPANVSESKYNYINNNGGTAIYDINNAMQELIIPDTVTTIRFDIGGHNGTTKIRLSEAVTTLSNLDFDGWGQSLSVRIPRSITSLCVAQFYPPGNRENGFAKIYVPNSVKSIGTNAFGDGYSGTYYSVEEVVVEDQATADLVSASGYVGTITVDPTQFQ